MSDLQAEKNVYPALPGHGDAAAALGTTSTAHVPAQPSAVYIVVQAPNQHNEEKYKKGISRNVGLILSSIQAVVAFLAIVFQVTFRETIINIYQLLNIS